MQHLKQTHSLESPPSALTTDAQAPLLVPFVFLTSAFMSAWGPPPFLTFILHPLPMALNIIYMLMTLKMIPNSETPRLG